MEREFEHRLTAVEDRSRSNTKRLDEIQKKQDDQEKLIEAVATIKTEQKHIAENVEKMDSKLQTLMDKPGKRWETVVAAAITGLVGYLLARMGVG